MKAAVLYPVQVLQAHVAELQTMMAACLSDPDHKPVHKLRTATRRVEAVLLLLGLVPGLPAHRKEVAATRRALRKLRRAAGTVRDLDVHRKMLEAFAGAEEAVAEEETARGDAAKGEMVENVALTDGAMAQTEPGDASSPAGADEAEGSAEVASINPAAKAQAMRLQAAAEELRAELGSDRDEAAAALQTVLRKRQVETTEDLDTLLAVLLPARDVALSGADLLSDAEAVLLQAGPFGRRRIAKLDEDELHNVRKAAKKARYLAEALPGDAALATAARRFEALQEAGGQWHDALEIAEAARRHFGKKHELAVTYREDRDRKLESYREALASANKPLDGPRQPKRAGAKGTASPARRRSPRKATAKRV